MAGSPGAPSTRKPNLLRSKKLWGAAVFSIVMVVVLAWSLIGSGDDAIGVTFTVKRGPLDIKVLEGGNVESLDSQEIKSEVAGWQGVKILQIVEEGYEITEEDIENNKLIVELDSSEFQKELTQAEITFKGTEASLTEAQQGYEIQINQSESDIYEAELAVTLAKLELEKYLGAGVTEQVLSQINLYQSSWEDERSREMASSDDALIETLANGGDDSAPVDTVGDMPTVEGEQPPPTADEAEAPADEPIEISLDALRMNHPAIPWSDYAKSEILGDGEANQLLQTNEDELLLAQKELGTSRQQLEGTQRLFDKGFVTQIELENDQTDRDKRTISVKAAETKQSVFINYEFPKQSETLLSGYIQAARKLERTEKQALSEIAKARGALASAQARFLIESNQIEEYKENIDKCKMFAKRPGLVVYGGGGDHYWNEEQIKEGATIRERQTIITIPDMSSMAVKVKIHESEIKLVQKDQKVRIVVDALRDRPLTGIVSQVAVLPDSDNRWMNPDLKVYETTIKIDGLHDWLKPGMSAETEILIERLPDVLYVPVQSVVPDGKDQVCFVNKGGTPERRVVTTGPVTVEYVVVESGLEEGEQVLVRPPEGSRNDDSEDDPFGEAVEEDAADDPATDTSETPPVVGQG